MNKPCGIQLATALAGVVMMVALVVSAADRHVSLTVTGAGTALSDSGGTGEVGWPSDFWTVFSNRVTAARNAGTAVTPRYSAVVAPAWVAATEGELGTVEEPFDSMDRFRFIVDVGLFWFWNPSTMPSAQRLRKRFC